MRCSRSHFGNSMSDDDVVQAGASDLVQPSRRPRGKAHARRHPVLLTEAVGGGRLQALAFAEAERRAASATDTLTEVLSLRAPSTDARCFAEVWVVKLAPLLRPVVFARGAGIATFVVACRRAGHSRDVLEAVELWRKKTSVTVMEMATELLADVVAGVRSCIRSVAVQSEADLGSVRLGLPLPPRSAFRAVLRATVHATGAEHRQRKRRRLDIAAGEVERRILWSKAGIRLRDQRALPSAVADIIAAVAPSEPGVTASAWTEDILGEKVRRRDLIRMEAVACLLYRRNMRLEATLSKSQVYHVVRSLRCDASPKLGAEILASEMDVITGLDPTTRRLQRLPGTTLAFGLSKLPQKVMMLLWGIFLMCGPSYKQMEYALSTFRFAVTDFGVESSIASCSHCLDMFFHFAAGRPHATAPSMNNGKLLFPNMIFVPGWHHLWSNLLKSAMESIDSWPSRLVSLRALTKFLKVDDYRAAWAASLTRAGLLAAASEVAKPFQASFLHWRWETISLVLAELARLKDILWNYFVAESFSKLEDGSLLAEVTAASKDRELLTWISRAAGVASLVEEMRLWGSWCTCHDTNYQGECHSRSRRLHQADSAIQGFCERVIAYRRSCTYENSCEFQSVMVETTHLCNHLISSVRLRFSWLRQLPYLLHSVCDKTCAQAILDDWASRPPERHHVVTLHVLQDHMDDVRAVARGDLPTTSLVAVQNMMRLCPLSEASIEGYHSRISFEHRRAHSSKLPWIFSRLAAPDNVAQLQAWFRRVCKYGLEFEWNRYKRVIKRHRSERAAALDFRAFVNVFYRIGNAQAGALREWSDQWTSHLAAPLPPRSDLDKLRRDFSQKVLQTGGFYSLGRDDGAGNISQFAFSPVVTWSGHEKLVDAGALSDHRDSMHIQPLAVAFRDGDSLSVNVVSVYPFGEPEQCVPWRLSGSWSTFRETLRVWQSTPSDMRGCLDLYSLVTPDAMCESDNLLAIVGLERLRTMGWRGADGVVVHDRDGRCFSMRNIVNRPEYIQAVLQWTALGVDSMRSDEPRRFYSCLLRGFAVPGRQPAKYYEEVLSGARDINDLLVISSADLSVAVVPQRPPQATPDSDSDVAQAMALGDVGSGDADDDDDGEGARRGVASSRSSSSSSSSSRSSSSNSRSSSSSSSDRGHDGGEAGGSRSGRSSRIGSSSNASPAGEPSEAAAGLAGPAEPLAGARFAPQDLPCDIDGARYLRETRAGAYERLVVICSHHQSCQRKRNTGMRPGAGLEGFLELVSFFGGLAQGRIGMRQRTACQGSEAYARRATGLAPRGRHVVNSIVRFAKIDWRSLRFTERIQGAHVW